MDRRGFLCSEFSVAWEGSSSNFYLFLIEESCYPLLLFLGLAIVESGSLISSWIFIGDVAISYRISSYNIAYSSSFKGDSYSITWDSD